jgi:cytoskeletal protein CcmA (bactofilin family)
MIKKSTQVNRDIVSTIIGEESEFKGAIHSQRSIRIEGNVEGEVNSQGEVHVGKTSRVKGNIFAKRVVVAGEVVGNIEATSGLEICNTGRVYGDISGDRLMIEEGAIYKGKVNMDVISSKNIYEGTLELVNA